MVSSHSNSSASKSATSRSRQKSAPAAVVDGAGRAAGKSRTVRRISKAPETAATPPAKSENSRRGSMPRNTASSPSKSRPGARKVNPASPIGNSRPTGALSNSTRKSQIATPVKSTRTTAGARSAKPPACRSTSALPSYGSQPTASSRNTRPAQQDAAQAGRVSTPRRNGLAAGSGRRRRPRFNHEVQLNRTNIPNYSPQFDRTLLKSLSKRKFEDLRSLGKTPAKNSLKVIPLGGLCEIGKNMTVYEYGNDMIIVDVGVAFPEESQPGIDSVIPDMHYVLENRHKLRAILLTHGHEDHIGSLSWLLRDVSCPIYGGRLTIELVKYKLEDKGIRGRDGDLHVIEAGDHVSIGQFDVEAIHVNHSIADAFSFAITTPEGVIIHSGDFKIDYTPIHGDPIDLRRFAALGEAGVLLFVCESTNIERKGFSSSERTVGDAFAQHFAGAPGRIIVATFSSNIHRVQQVVTAAEAVGRKVALVGRSMLNVFKAANNLGYIDMQTGTLIDISEINQYPPEQLVVITTGSQGEPLAALTRMAFSEHRFVEINASDTVIISATPIPGNEKPIYRVINELYKRGAKVVYSSLADIHVSGHAYREEIKIMHQLIHPRYFLPAHGEYRHLHMHADLANEMGQPWQSIYLLNNGDIFEIDGNKVGITGYTEASAILIDGSPASHIDSQVLDQRRTLSDDGVIAIALAVDTRKECLVSRPIIHTRGFIYEKDIQAMDSEIIKRINLFINKARQSAQPLGAALRANALRDQLQNLLYSRTERRPVLLLSVIEV